MSRHRRATRPTSKAGMPPGTLVYTGERKLDKTRLTLIDYDAQTLNEVASETLTGCLARRDAPSVTWINVDGLHDVDLVAAVGNGYGVHPLALEDVLSIHQRPKFEDYESHLFLVVQMMAWDAAAESVSSEQVSFVLGPHFLLTFQEQGGDVFDPIRERLRANRGRLRKLGPDYLLYALLDVIVDNYFVILEKLDERIEQLEEELTQSPSHLTLQAIHRMKREMIFLRRAVWPLREVIGAIGRTESDLIQPETRLFLRDIQDHAMQVIETVETFRDLLAGMLDLYMSTISNRLNAVMKVLTIIATIFIPLTFIAGVYGMNFEFMPELHWRWAYPAILAIMLLIGGGMLWIFRKRGWL